MSEIARHWKELHSWNVTPDEAIALQRLLAAQVEQTDGFDLKTVRTIAGIDVSLKDEGQAAVAVLSFPEMELVEGVVATAPITFPYVPGLLSFRESPLVLAALERLTTLPDILMVDGQGMAHPRRFGIACHLGLLTGIPSLGVAKSVLCGKHGAVGVELGAMAPLIHRGETIGMAFRSKIRTNPLIISVGHKMCLQTAVELVVRCNGGYRLPEPTRVAHNLAGSSEAHPVSDPRKKGTDSQQSLF